MQPEPCGSSKLRVAIVAPSLATLGGQAVQAERIVSAWRGDPDVEAWLVPIDRVPRGVAGGLARVRYVGAVLAQACFLPRLPRELAHADVVHVFSRAYRSFLLAPLQAIVTARALRRPVIVHYHHGEGPDHLRRSAVARAALARVDRNVVPSAYLQSVFEELGLRADVVPNLIDLDRFAFRLREPIRPRLPSTRNFYPLYNVACTLRAFGIVQRVWPEATLTLAGRGPQLETLRALASSLGLAHVRFAGRVSPDEMPRLFDQHDIYIQSPDVDNVPNSVVEAFASGLPVVATAAGGVPMMTRHGELALLGAPGDHEALATHVLRLLSAPDLVRSMTTAARAASQAYGWSQVREAWLRLYGSLVSPSGRHAGMHAAARDEESASVAAAALPGHLTHPAASAIVERQSDRSPRRH